MPRTTITIEATIDLPDDRPSKDYIRAIGNYIVDVLPTIKPNDGDRSRIWSAGSNTTLQTRITIEDDEL